MFIRALVVEVISHPSQLNDNIINRLLNDNNSKLNEQKSNLLIRDLPRNSIIAQLKNENQRIIAIPFFSSHIGFPLKPGESVWLFKEDNADTGASLNTVVEYFWLSRIHGMNFFEDSNYTHDDRKFLKKYENKLNNQLSLNSEVYLYDKNIVLDKKQPIAQFNNGPIANSNSKRFSNPAVQTLNTSGLNISGRYLIEDIPRVTKNPGDFILQGSNNTLIKLGTNFANNSSEYLYKFNTISAYQSVQKYSGTIDIVAGRAAISKKYLSKNNFTQYELNGKDIFYNQISNNSFRNGHLLILNEKNTFENMKDSEYYLGTNFENLSEGDPDFFSDISRIYVSERSNGDELISNYSLFTVENDIKANKKLINFSGNRGYIIGKSDEIRLVARNKVFDLNENENLYQGEGGSIRLIKEGDSTNQASVLLNHEGIVSINGSKIVIGDIDKIKENGKSEQVYIGHGAKEPLVLGYFLKNKLENFMNEVCKSLVLINKNLDEINTKFNNHLDEYDTHIHTFNAVPPGSPPSPTSPTIVPSASQISNSLTIPDKLDKEGINDPVKDEEKDGEYGTIKDMNLDPNKISDNIQNIILIKNSLVEVLSMLGKTL